LHSAGDRPPEPTPRHTDGDSLRVTVLKTIPEDPELAAAWNDLVMGMENPEVFFTYQWALAAARGFREKLNPLLFLIHDDAQNSALLVGVAALAVDSDSSLSAHFLASNTADYCDIVSSPENRRDVLLALLQELQRLGFGDLVLAGVPSNSATLQHVSEVAKASGFYTTSRASSDCGIVELGDEEHRKALLQTVVSKNREKRGLKKLAALGPVSVAHLTDGPELRPTLDAIISAQISRFLASGRESPLLDPERREFLAQLADSLVHAGWLKISQLEVNGKAVAWNYGFLFKGSWFWYLPAFEIDLEYASPGSCLLRLLVEEACGDTSLRWLDLGLGDESYKVRFANNVRPTRYVQLSRSLPGHAAKVGRQAAVSALTRSPKLEQSLRRARERYRRLQERFRNTGAVATVRHSLRTAARSVSSQSELQFFEYSGTAASDNLPNLLPLTREHLVQASIQNAADKDTLTYLTRCAQRMTQTEASGYVLLNDEGQPVHFLWTAAYDGFHLSEIDHKLEAISPSAVVIFDCWTPAASRGHSYYASAIRSAATRLQREGKTPWIFSMTSNVPSLQGIRKAGFSYRFSLVRRVRFGDSTIGRENAAPEIVAN